MDALRLIAATRQALFQSSAVHDIVAEAWQAQALAEAIGTQLAHGGPPELRAEAQALKEAATRPTGVTERPQPPEACGPRAVALTLVEDPQCALRGLGELLGEVGAALVAVAVTADDEALYWQCIEAIDTADESGDRVVGMLRKLALREHGVH